MRYVILRDDDTNAFTPVECLERLYRPFLERGLPVNLAVIPSVRTDAIRTDGLPEQFLFGKNGCTELTMPIGRNEKLARYLRDNPGFHIVQHGCNHSLFEFDSKNAGDICNRLEQGTKLLLGAGFSRPQTFVAPYDRFSSASLREAAKRFRIISTGWFELRRLPRAWWPRYALEKCLQQPHWRAGETILLSHPGCLLSRQRSCATMLDEVKKSIASRQLTVLVTHWWEYFPDGKPDDTFIEVLHETASWLADQPDVRVISFDDLAQTGLEIKNGLSGLVTPLPKPQVATAAQVPEKRRTWISFFRYEHRNRLLALDMLRGVAILLVLGCHYVVAPVGLGWLQPLAAGWRTIGWAGVDLFFVLSGFLVSGLLFAEYRRRRQIDVGRFVVRRGFRIWPPYFIYLAVVALWLGWQQQGNISAVWTALWPNFFHVQNYFHTPRIHTWSLAVEEHFYLAVALVFFWGLRGQHAAAFLKKLPLALVMLVVALAVLRHIEYLHYGPEQLNLYATHLRFDGLVVGTLLAYWTYFEPEKIARLTRWPLALMIVGVVIAAPTLIFSPEASVWTAGMGLTGVYVGFGLILLGWLHLDATRGMGRWIFSSRGAALLGQVGFYSYSIYLWHVDFAQTPVKKLVAMASGMHIPASMMWLAATTIYVFVAVVVGSLLSRLLEIPSLALRDRLFPKK